MRYNTERKRRLHRESQMRYKLKDPIAYNERRKANRDPKKYAEASRRYREREREKYSARRMVRQRVSYGLIIRPDHCARCSSPCKPEAHHRDYSKPYEVEWICRKCHLAEHGKQLRVKG